MSLVYCQACGAKISESAVACPKCGHPNPTAKPSGPARSLPGSDRLTAILLAIFLGGLGFHKFYLGKTTLGILYLLFCWTFIPGLIAFIEGVVYLSISDEEFARKYGKK